MRSRIVAAACVVLAALGLWWWHEAHESNKAMAASDVALASGDVTLAIERARETAMHLSPSSHQAGFERLASIADDAEARGDVATMKTALLAMRAAADSTDDATWRARANDALPRCAMREGASADVITPMKLELATPTHPPQTAHLAIALLALVLGAVAMRLTRRSSQVAPQK